MCRKSTLNCLFKILCITLSFLAANVAFARKGVQALYQHPFDTGGGGTNLCIASHEGVMFSNPALMPWGNKTFRWVGAKLQFLAEPNSFFFFQQQDSTAARQQAVDTPVHLGFASIFSVITNNFGLGVFGYSDNDVKINRYGEFGFPELRIRNNVYSGLIMAGGFTLGRNFSLGVAGKAMSVAELDERRDVTDNDAFKNLFNTDQIAPGNFDLYSADLGMLYNIRGSAVDFRFALKVDDIGDTKRGDETVFPMIYHAGMSVTFHTNSDMVHLELNYRDIGDAYEETLLKKVYAGGKITVENIIALSGGLYHGSPSVGLALDFIILNFGASYYVKEIGTSIGDEPREIIEFYINGGI